MSLNCSFLNRADWSQAQYNHKREGERKDMTRAEKKLMRQTSKAWRAAKARDSRRERRETNAEIRMYKF